MTSHLVFDSSVILTTLPEQTPANEKSSFVENGLPPWGTEKWRELF